ncbi:MBL fold metallo-hydrolase [Acidianus sulfidivorans JP7]|uniref:MBL fold metallo-hydrolase n=1 Tax=Acidianus sulfidivorans JP7 TaxID=619593 RepID=A0A2U9IPX1_9CREN|nr:MBL fold metallo-hydrolase [Acidianus sulfidivorans]AWR98043.1 MBL fold metallo-hydrolase [Acidianus sulfidivorans JP7]
MVKIKNNIRIAELLEPNFFGTILNHNVVIVEKGPSGGLMIIDTSLPCNIVTLENYLKSWGYSLEDISDIVITHSHPDHYGNAEYIKKIAKAKIYAHELEDFNSGGELNKEEIKKEFPIDDEEIEKTVKRIGAINAPIPSVDVKLKGGEDLAGFKVIHVPGHTKGHIALFGQGVLIVGDAIRNTQKMIRPPIKFFCWDYEKALKSYNYLLSLNYEILVPYHGDLVFK